jgi:CDP-glucose 4,6-dehydratase
MIISMEKWLNRSVLVTGATGLVGRTLCRRLKQLGATVVAVVRDDVVPRFRDADAIVRGDICDHVLMRRVIVEHEVGTVFHLAAQTIVGTANRDPLSTWESNIRGTYSLLEAIRVNGRGIDVVVASTDKAYGCNPELPTRESQPLQPDYPYDVSKACADLICHSYAVTFGVDVVVTRCGNLFGEGDVNWNRLVPGTMRSLIQGTPPIVRSNGLLVRDYLYVGNAVDAYISLAERMIDDRLTGSHSLRGEAFNISDYRELSVVQMIEKIRESLGLTSSLELQTIILDEPCKEIPVQYLDSTKIRDTIGWKAPIGLEEALQKTADWYTSHLDVQRLGENVENK